MDTLNHQSPIPLYHQLADIILEKIRLGAYPPESKIPSENRLAEIYGIGRPTARQATDLLVRRRILIRKRGSGTFVQTEPKEVDLFSLAGTITSFHKKGISVTTSILEKTKLITVGDEPENPFADKTAYFLCRLSKVGENPVLIEDIYLHAALFTGIDSIDLSEQSLSRIVSEKYYMTPTDGKQNFSIGYLTGKKANDLSVSPETPILIVKRFLNFPQAKQAVYSELFCRTDQFVFSQTIGGIKDV